MVTLSSSTQRSEAKYLQIYPLEETFGKKPGTWDMKFIKIYPMFLFFLFNADITFLLQKTPNKTNIKLITIPHN